MQIIKLPDGINFDAPKMIEVTDGEFYVFNPRDKHFSGFKTEGVSCCFACIAILKRDERYYPIALGHFVPVGSKDCIEDARIEAECFMDKINSKIGKMYSEGEIIYKVIGGVNSSKNTYEALTLMKDDYNIISIDFNVAPNEDSAIDVYVDSRGIYYSCHVEFDYKIELDREVHSAASILRSFSRIRVSELEEERDLRGDDEKKSGHMHTKEASAILVKLKNHAYSHS